MSAAVAAAPGERGSGEYLVGFDGDADLALLAGQGAELKRVLGSTGVALVHASEGVARALQAHPGVRYVVPNQPLHLDGTTWEASTWDASTWDASTWDASTWDASTWDASTWDASTWDASTWDASTWDGASADAGYGVQWGLGATHTHHAWQTTRNSTATVCLLDTGVDTTHVDLQGSILSNPYNAMDGSSNVTDNVGHGTHVAGIIAAKGGNSDGIVGVAQTQLLVVKVMDVNGGTEADLIAGLDHCVSRGAKIASMSLHVTAPDAALQDAVTRAQNAGMLLVAAAGNDGAATIPYPAAYAGVLAVGAVKPDGTVASFSNHGPDLDLVAPGYRIGSTAAGGGYKMGTGTSQAVPFVSGAAALAWHVKPTLTASQLSGILTGTARDIGAAGYDTTSGYGVVDAHEAVLRAQIS